MCLAKADSAIAKHEAVVEAVVACWVIDACCLLCLCFTGSRCHYSVTAVLLPSLIPDLSGWFPVGGSCPATTSLLHHPCLCLHVHQSGDGDLSQHTNLSRVSPSLSLSCNHHCAYFSFFCRGWFRWLECYHQSWSHKCEFSDFIRGTSWGVFCLGCEGFLLCITYLQLLTGENQMNVEQEFQGETRQLELYCPHCCTVCCVSFMYFY